jgi:hypothetical protein
MQRLLVEVLEVKREKRYKNRQGLQCSQVDCLVKVKDTARKTLRLPKGIRGKRTKVTRQCLLPWEIKPGDNLVLDPQESRRVIAELIPPSFPQGIEQPYLEQALLYSQDVNYDGLKENILENSFLKAIIAPHYGARLWELWAKGKNQNQLFGSGSYDKDGWVELGGVEESISGMEKPDELWNANYKRGGSQRQPAFNYHFSCKKEEGLETKKSFSIEPNAPILYQVSEFKYRGKDKKPKEKEEISIEYCPKVFFAMGGEANFHNLFFVPTRETLIKARYHKPAWTRRWEGGFWDWRRKCPGIDPGFILLSNEIKGDSLAVLFHPKMVSFAWVGTNSRSPRLFLSHCPQKLKKGAKVSYGIIYILADAFDLNQSSLLLLSLGKGSSSSCPLAITLRSSKRYKDCSVTLTIDGEERKVILKPKGYPQVGKVFHRCLIWPQDFSSVSVSFKKGGESLGCQLKGEEK